ncbi:hypothetical protein DNTS_004247 [Danionella cerebrum]|uniref:receptor protein-tyrosine kinase n=1 Tax=Danionella cerebrum TaxID=2873325 RepID=A0A553MNL5_9TELE|nr:hypothetical protein DNTS_004247 [Danionella translucida]
MLNVSGLPAERYRICTQISLGPGWKTLMDSRWATTELAWTTYPESGWEEVSGYDDMLSPIRTYQVCNVQKPNQNNWLRTDFIPRRGVLRVYVELKFSVRDCGSIPNIPGSCKETFNLFYYESDGDAATTSSPPWRENPYVKVDTIAPDESFSLLESGIVNTKVRSFGPLSKAGFYLAFQDLGACMSLISARVFFKKCSTTIANFAVFPETATGAEATSLVIAAGACVPNAVEESVPLKLYCNGDGEWMVPVGACTCMPGFEPAKIDTQCQGKCWAFEISLKPIVLRALECLLADASMWIIEAGWKGCKGRSRVRGGCLLSNRVTAKPLSVILTRSFTNVT